MSELGKIPEDYATGPAMLALADDRRRRFCFLMGSGLTTGAEAAREAGYSDNNAAAAKKRAYVLLQQESIQAAIREVATKALGGLVPASLRALQEILDDPAHPQRARTAETILDRTGYSAKVEQRITVEHRHDTAQLEKFAQRLAVEMGLAPDALLPPSQIIDLEPVQIPPPDEPA